MHSFFAITLVVMVGFVHSSYSVSEAFPEVEVCVQVSGAPYNTTELGRPVLARISNLGGTATGTTHTHAWHIHIQIALYSNFSLL